MIIHELVEYLTDPNPITGQAELPFITPIPIYTAQRQKPWLTIANHNEARRHLQSFVGNRIYHRRRPKANERHTAITLDLITENAQYHLQGEHDTSRSWVQVNCHGYDPGGDRAASVASELIRAAISGYYGPWGMSFVDSCVLDRASSHVSRSAPGEPWQHRVANTYFVSHTQPRPSQPTELLTAVISTPTTSRVEVSANDSIIPQGRSWIDVAWEIRVDDPQAAPTVSWSGDPNAAVTALSVAGTNAHAIIADSLVPIGELFATTTITDSTGATSTTTKQIR